eukprot:scaffold16621_cov527-Ochromonas_danica.AAC.1
MILHVFFIPLKSRGSSLSHMKNLFSYCSSRECKERIEEATVKAKERESGDGRGCHVVCIERLDALCCWSEEDDKKLTS